MGDKLEKLFKNEKKLKSIIPSYRFREEQYEMARGIYDVITKDEILLIESPCGTGKTLAYIIPAFLYAEETNKKVIISTSTITLQNQLMNDFIMPMSKLFPKLKGTKLLGKSNYLCLMRASDYLSKGFASPKEEREIESLRVGNGEFESEVIEDISKEVKTLNCNYELCENFKCPFFMDCFYFNSRKDGIKSDILIVNHSLYLSEKKLKYESGNSDSFIMPSHELLIIDEAHKLPDMITSSFTDSLNGKSIYNLLFMMDKIENDKKLKESHILNLSKLKGKLLDDSENFFKFMKNRYKKRKENFLLSELERNRISKKNEFKEFLDSLEEISSYICENFTRNSEFVRISLNFKKLADFLHEITLGSENKFYWIDNGINFTIHSSPYSVDNIFTEFFSNNLKSMVLLSGTLGLRGDFTFYKSLLNLKNSIDLSYYSDFDRELSRICYIPDSMPTPKDENFFSSLILEIDKIAKLVSGRTLILFTSLSLMNSAHEELKIPLELSGRIVLLQGESGKSKLMKQFRENENSILFASQSFWEGIDLKGNPLRSLILTRLPFNVPDDPIAKARSENLEKNGINPFKEFFIPTAIMRLKQGIGRLIRDKNQWGVISILDSRILNSGYGKFFIREMETLKIVTKTDDIKDFIVERNL